MTEKKNAAWVARSLVTLVGVSVLVFALGGGYFFYHLSKELPQIITVADYHPLGVSQVYAIQGTERTLVGEFYKERRFVVPPDKIPKLLVHAIISAEDDQFFSHQGVNLMAILRASIANLRAGQVVQGGSTITQQMAKTFLLTSERSFLRKAKELILAHRIEKNLTKNEILYLYLNQIYLGHGAYGIEAAAQVFFRKTADTLSLAEAAMIAGMPQAPGKFSPHLNPKKAKERQLYVLRRMLENGYISKAEQEAAAVEPLKIYDSEDVNEKYSPYWIEHLRQTLLEKYGEKKLFEEGITVEVPVKASTLLAARRALQEGLRAIDKRMGYRGPLQTLKTDVEIVDFIEKENKEIAVKKLGFEVLTADGRLDYQDSIRSSIESDSTEGLLEAGERYKAVVLNNEADRKQARVSIGKAQATLPLAGLRWARSSKDFRAVGAEPNNTSAVVNRGDVIWVKVEKNTKGAIEVSLDQEPVVQGALFSVDVTNGEVLAFEGGYDFRESKFNRVLQAKRQPGSSFKPIIFASALENGYTPVSIIVDSPIVYEDGDYGKWKPTNFEEKFYGDTTFRQALIKSRNVPTIKIVQSLSVPKVIEYARRIGIEAQFPQDLSISLGSAQATLYEMTKAYAVFPRFGRMVSPQFFSRVLDRSGKVLEANASQPIPDVEKIVQDESIAHQQSSAGAAPEADASAGVQTNGDPGSVIASKYPLPGDPTQVMDPRIAFVMTNLMKEVVAFGTGHAAQTLGRVSAGKTGTTNDYQDAWYIGFTPQVVTGVWVGFDALRSIGPGETGARAALPIWLSFMQEAMKDYPIADFQVPPGVVFASINSESGQLSPANASSSIKEAFISGTEPKATERKAVRSTEKQKGFFKEEF